MPETKEHGFLFKAEMIREILAGFKSQTRRVCTAHNSLIDGSGYGIRAHWKHLQWDRAWVDRGPSPAGNPGQYWKVPCNCMGDAKDIEVVHRVYPRVQPGDSIWARETWRAAHADVDKGLWIQYRADKAKRLVMPPGFIEWAREHLAAKWRSPLHMPKWAARIVVPVTMVRAARVMEIDCNDAVAEGTPDLRTLKNNWGMRDCFAALWDSINGDRTGMTFADDPPVWVYQWEPMA